MQFLRNAWYVAATSAEVTVADMLSRTVLNQPLLLFRDAAGSIAALDNRCPHRLAPLHAGVLRDGVVECPYHGLRFDQTGRCIFNPHGDGDVPTAMRVRRYPARERHGFVWVWTGAEELSSELDIPDFSFLDPEMNELRTGYLHTRANYQLSVDNLLDLSHLHFLHRSTLGSTTTPSGTSTFLQQGDTVVASRFCASELLQPFVAQPFGAGSGALTDRWFDVRWDAPGLLAINVCVAPHGMPREGGLLASSGHFLTPETERTTHYFFGFGLPKTMQEAARALVDYAVEGLTIPFQTEDLPILEAQQVHLDNVADGELTPVHLPIDGGAIRARRIMERKLAREAESQKVSPLASLMCVASAQCAGDPP